MLARLCERWTRAMDRNSLATGGRLIRLLVQYANDQPEFEKYLGKSLGQIAEEEDKHPIDVMLDLAIATDLKAEFLSPLQKYTFSISRPMEVVVLNCWVTETNDTPRASNSSI